MTATLQSLERRVRALEEAERRRNFRFGPMPVAKTAIDTTETEAALDRALMAAGRKLKKARRP